MITSQLVLIYATHVLNIGFFEIVGTTFPVLILLNLGIAVFFKKSYSVFISAFAKYSYKQTGNIIPITFVLI